MQDQKRYSGLAVARRRNPSYAWALHTHVSTAGPFALSEQAEEGLEYAIELARDAGQRSRQALRNQPPPELEPLSIEQLAAETGLPAAVIRARVRRARRELFGQLTDSGIYKRLRRQRQLRDRRRKPRSCQQTGCASTLPVAARSNRRYCDEHASPRGRVRRHRARLASQGLDRDDLPA
jgi:hypothetical protein